MGPLGVVQHEEFCKRAHRRMLEGQKRSAAFGEAYLDVIYQGDLSDPARVDAARHNGRRLGNRKEIKARIVELGEYAAALNGVDDSWAMKQLKDRVADYNIDDYLTPRLEGVQRFIDISRSSRAQLARLAEISIEEDIVEAGEETMRKVRKTKIKPYDPASLIGLMARIRGWEAPKKTAFTDPKGDGPGELVVYSSLDKARAVAAILAKAKAEAKAA